MRSFFNLIINIILYPIHIILILLIHIVEYSQVSMAISLIPFGIGMRIRKNFYRQTLKACGNNVTFGFGSIISYKDIIIGDNVRIGPYNTLGKVNIGNDVITAQNCSFLSGTKQHKYERLDLPMWKQHGSQKTIFIGNDVWIGCGVIAAQNIGDGCVIGAGSVVVKNIEDYSIAVGNPAKIIKKRK